MTNHIHLIARAKEPFQLSDIVRDFKKFTANHLLPLLHSTRESRRNSVFQIWTHENHAMELFTQKVTQQKVDYIHNNSVRAGIVERPEDYLYSNAENYAGLRGMVKIDFL